MLKGRDIIVTGLQSWDIEIGSNCKNLAIEFSKNNRVLYVNAPLDFLTALKKSSDPKTIHRQEVITGKKEELIEIMPNLWNLTPAISIASINQMSVDFIFDFFNKRNNKKIATRIQSAIERLGFKDFILFNDSDMFRGFYLKELLKPKTYVYYTRDNLLAVDYWKKQGLRLEPAHMKKADLVVANSTYLAKLAKIHNPNSYYVGQGCDLSLFKLENHHQIPDDMKNIPKPIIGYIGALLSLRLDIEILEYIADKKPEISLVLVGPEDDAFKSSSLHAKKNVYFLGNKDGNELPAYLSQFDIAINPQILNPVTIGNYPRKIDEYLAMGKSVIATKTEAMSVFSEYTFLAESKEDYLKYIEKALKDENPEIQISRSLFASGHSWENNVNEIYKHILNFESKN